MTAQHLQLVYYFTLASVLLNQGLLMGGRADRVRWTGWLPVLSGFFAWFGGILYSGHPPIYNRFETLQQIVLVMLLLEQCRLVLPRKGTSRLRGSQAGIWGLSHRWTWGLALLLLALVPLFGMEPDADGYYMYEKAYVVLFFQLRITSMGFFAHALAMQLDGQPGPSRNFVLLGAALYLAGEFSGSWWAQLWWGDPWHWSKGFFLATVMFLLALVESHIPGRYRAHSVFGPLLRLGPLCLILIVYLFSH